MQVQGINAYSLFELSARNDWAGLESIFAQAKAMGRTVLRTNAFHIAWANEAFSPSHTYPSEAGLLALDALLDAARTHNIRLVLTLMNHWQDYGGAPAFASHFSSEARSFYSHPKIIEATVRYFENIVGRSNSINSIPYAQDATVYAWELCNEARYGMRWFSSSTVLTSWAATLSSALRGMNPVQPIAWGGHGFFGEYGEDIELIAQIPDIDILTLHTYPEPIMRNVRYEDQLREVLKVAATQGIMTLSNFAKRLRGSHKTLWVEEMGWPQGVGPNTAQERAELFATWIECAENFGMGFFPWMIAEAGRPDYDGYLIR